MFGWFKGAREDEDDPSTPIKVEKITQVKPPTEGGTWWTFGCKSKEGDECTCPDDSDKWKVCMKEGGVRLGGGIFTGLIWGVLSLSGWPIVFGTGLGIGLALDHCEKIADKMVNVQIKPKEEC
jgi:hypothetical protein